MHWTIYIEVSIDEVLSKKKVSMKIWHQFIYEEKEKEIEWNNNEEVKDIVDWWRGAGGNGVTELHKNRWRRNEKLVESQLSSGD